MKQISLPFLVIIAVGLSACSSSGGGGGSIELSDKTAVHRADQCPRLTGSYCTSNPGTMTCDGHRMAVDSNGNPEYSENGDYILAADGDIPKVVVDGRIRDATARNMAIKTQAYCTNGSLTKIIHAGSRGALSETLSLSSDGRTLTVVTKGSGAASRLSGTETYTKQN